MKQQNKIIVVGATSGLGRMLAERYIRDGHVVGIVGRRGDKLAEVAKGHSEVHCLKADVTDIYPVCSPRFRASASVIVQ